MRAASDRIAPAFVSRDALPPPPTTATALRCAALLPASQIGRWRIFKCGAGPKCWRRSHATKGPRAQRQPAAQTLPLNVVPRVPGYLSATRANYIPCYANGIRRPGAQNERPSSSIILYVRCSARACHVCSSMHQPGIYHVSHHQPSGSHALADSRLQLLGAFVRRGNS